MTQVTSVRRHFIKGFRFDKPDLSLNIHQLKKGAALRPSLNPFSALLHAAWPPAAGARSPALVPDRQVAEEQLFQQAVPVQQTVRDAAVPAVHWPARLQPEPVQEPGVAAQA